jgi:hypothetical protein
MTGDYDVVFECVVSFNLACIWCKRHRMRFTQKLVRGCINMCFTDMNNAKKLYEHSRAQGWQTRVVNPETEREHGWDTLVVNPETEQN